MSMGDYARGLELLKRSAALDPECPLPYVNGARAYLGMNDLVAARRQGYNCGWCNRSAHQVNILRVIHI